MICVLPTHRGDTARLKDLLLWMQQLGGCHGHSALIVADAGTPYREVLDIRTAAAKVFTTTDLTVNDRPTSGWIEGPKSLFFEAARWCYEKTIGPWLWLETDAIPLRPQWLDALQTEYAAKGKAVMGCVYRSTAPEFPDPLMSGVAVFAWDAYQNLKRGDRNFDLDFQDYAMVNGANTTLIQHLWGGKNMPPTFVSVKANPVLVNIFTLDDLWPTAVLFHRNKDGTLVRLLRDKMFATNQPDTCLVELGRYGDIINILPVAYAMAQRSSRRVALLAASKYADMLEGCSYVKPEVFDGPFEHLYEAIEFAKTKYPNVVPTQVYSNRGLAEKKTDSFCKDSWRLAGFLHEWGHLPLIFDARNKQRELELVEAHNGSLPMLLVNLSGNSSPFKGSASLMGHIHQRWDSKFHVIDLGNIQAERIYDLLGLYEAAHGLVTIDTATLHLAAASDIPTVELFVTQEWPGSPQKARNCLVRIPYAEVLIRLNDIDRAIARMVPRERTIRFVWSNWTPSDDETRRRISLSQKTVQNTLRLHPDCDSIGIKDAELPRLFSDGKTQLPYVKDMIEKAVESLDDNEWIMLVNFDICFGDNLYDAIKKQVTTGRLFIIRRNDFGRLYDPMPAPLIPRGRRYVGADAFGFPAHWWRENRDTVPDMLLGREAWDMVLSKLILMSGGDILYDMIYHEQHNSVWSNPVNRTTLSSQKYNIRLAQEFCKMYKLNPADYGVPKVQP